MSKIKRLIKRLESDKLDKRIAAIEALGKTKDALAFQPLMEKLLDAKGSERVAAVVAMGELQDNRAKTLLIDALSDEIGQVRYAAAVGLEKLGDAVWVSLIDGSVRDFIRLVKSDSIEPGNKKLIGPLIEALCSRDVALSNEAAEALIKLNDPCVVDELIQLLESKENWESAVKVLVQLNDPRVVDKLIQVLENKENWESAVIALGQLNDPRAVRSLVKKIHTINLGSRRSDYLLRIIIDAISQIHGIKAQKALIQLLNIDSLDAKKHIKAAIMKSQKPNTVELLIKRLETFPKCIHTAKMLGEIKDDRAVEVLCSVVKKNKEAVKALGKIGDLKAVKPLIKVIENADDKNAEDAMDVLIGLNDPDASEYLYQFAISHFNKDIKLKASKALAHHEDERAVSVLIPFLSLDKDYRKEAAKALKRAGEPIWNEAILGNDTDYNRLAELEREEVVDIVLTAYQNGNCPPEVLAKLENSKAISALIQSMGSWDNNRRRGAANALYKLGETRWVKIVKGEYQDFVGLAQSGDKRVKKPLLAAFKSKKENKFIIEAMGELGAVEAVDDLVKILQSQSFIKTRQLAGLALLNIAKKNPNKELYSKGVANFLRTPHVDKSRVNYDDGCTGFSTKHHDAPHIDKGLGLGLSSNDF